jgi:hypothetical protein
LSARVQTMAERLETSADATPALKPLAEAVAGRAAHAARGSRSQRVRDMARL